MRSGRCSGKQLLSSPMDAHEEVLFRDVERAADIVGRSFLEHAQAHRLAQAGWQGLDAGEHDREQLMLLGDFVRARAAGTRIRPRRRRPKRRPANRCRCCGARCRRSCASVPPSATSAARIGPRTPRGPRAPPRRRRAPRLRPSTDRAACAGRSAPDSRGGRPSRPTRRPNRRRRGARGGERRGGSRSAWRGRACGGLCVHPLSTGGLYSPRVI